MVGSVRKVPYFNFLHVGDVSLLDSDCDGGFGCFDFDVSYVVWSVWRGWFERLGSSACICSALLCLLCPYRSPLLHPTQNTTLPGPPAVSKVLERIPYHTIPLAVASLYAETATRR